MGREPAPLRSEPAVGQAALEGVQQVQQRPGAPGGAAPENPCPWKAAESIQGQLERGSPDQVGDLLGTGTRTRLDVAEKDECDVVLVRVDQPALMARQRPLKLCQRGTLLLIRPQSEEKALSHRPRAVREDAPAPAARTGDAPLPDSRQTAHIAPQARVPPVPRRTRRSRRACPRYRHPARRYR